MSNNTFKLHREALDPSRQKLLRILVKIDKEIVLGGGTALSLQIVHRQSFDFDFFSKTELSKKLLEVVRQTIKISRVSRDMADELTFYDTNNIKITFLYYPFGKVFDFVKTEDHLNYFPLKTVAFQKAYTIGRRGVYRDYFDIYALLKGKYITLKEIIGGAEDIYGTVFNPKIFLEQLVYFTDLTNFEIMPISKSQKIPHHGDVKKFLEATVREYLY